jgi:hypothetical protein
VRRWALVCLTACGRFGFDAIGSDADARVCDAATGSWQIIAGGDFETGVLPASWIADGSAVGTFTLVQSPVYAGAWSLRGTPNSISTAGYSIGPFGIPVTPDNRYVLSGFLLASATDTLYLDLHDEPFDPNVAWVPGVPGWQFVSAVVTIPSGVTSVRVRVVHDATLDPSRSVYADEVALTPEAEFVPPTCR